VKAEVGTTRRATLPARRAGWGSAATRAAGLEDDEATEPPNASARATERMIAGTSRLPSIATASRHAAGGG